MPLQLVDHTAELEWFPIYFDRESKGQDPWPLNENGAPLHQDSKTLIELDENERPVDDSLGIEACFFGLKRLSSGDMMKISNRVYKMDRKGRSSFEYGTAAHEKVMAACKKCKNIGTVSDPDAEVPFNQKVLNGLPQWVTDRLTDRINEANNLSEDEEQD